MSSEFEKLASELEVLAKAQKPTEEDKVLEAAETAGVDVDQIGDGAGKGDAGALPNADDGAKGGDEDGDEDEVLGKSFQVMGGDGSPVKAYDATDLIKSLNERIMGLESGFEDVAERREHLGKSMGLITDLLKSQSTQLIEQAQNIATLRKSIEDMGGQGRGRKAVIAISEKPELTMTKSVQPEGLSGQDFMAKAMDAQRLGRITANDIAIAEGSLNRGLAVPVGIVSRVMGNQ